MNPSNPKENEMSFVHDNSTAGPVLGMALAGAALLVLLFV